MAKKVRKSQIQNEIQNVVSLIKKHKINSPEKAKQVGIELTHLGSGLFRDGYRVKNLPIVFKFVKGTNYDSGINHARKELKAIETIMTKRKYKALRRYMPTVYYANKRNGLIVMKYYAFIDNDDGLVSDVLYHLAYDLGLDSNDTHTSNVGYEEGSYGAKTVKITDLGYYEF